MPDTSAHEINELIRLGRKYKWATGEVRANLERHGVNLVRSDFYSESPSLDDIEASFEYVLRPGETGKPAVFDDPAIFDLDTIAQVAETLVAPAADFEAPVEADTGFFWKNTQFSSIDALAYYALIRSRRPRRIIEIGSGFSTHVAHRAISEMDAGQRLICIDPDPRTEIETLDGIEFRRRALQTIEPEALMAELHPGDILFYDGSHSLKTGSDTVYFYLKILPYLPSGVIVHAHDVHLPYARNKEGLTQAKIYWGEQYVVMAHLHNTARYRVLFATEFLRKRQPEVLNRMMAGRYPVFGGSLWFQIR